MAIQHVLNSREITVTTWDNKHSLTMGDGVFTIDFVMDHRTIPFNHVISMQVKDPKGKLRPGMITLELDAPPNTIIHAGAGILFTSGTNVKFPHSYEDLEAGREMLRRFQEYQRYATAGNSYGSAADEIKKFKDLLDLGIITQEEFELKKRQLLGV